MALLKTIDFELAIELKFTSISSNSSPEFTGNLHIIDVHGEIPTLRPNS